MTTIKEGDELALPTTLRERARYLRLQAKPIFGTEARVMEVAADEIERLRSQHNGATQGYKCKAVIDALWPILGGNHTDAETWREIGDAVCAALSTSSPDSEDSSS